MNRPALALSIVLAGLLLTAAAGVVGYRHGRAAGLAAEVARQDAAAVQELTGLITSQRDLIGQANTASAGLRETMAARVVQDQRFSKEFRNALKLSAAARAGCRFDDDSVRQLGAARDRAAAATFGSGSGSSNAAMPGASNSLQR